MQITCSLLVYELKMAYRAKIFRPEATYTRWFKYDRDDLRVNKSQFVPVIFEPPCINNEVYYIHRLKHDCLTTILLVF